jgi:hypothetical protein
VLSLQMFRTIWSSPAVYVSVLQEFELAAGSDISATHPGG